MTATVLGLTFWTGDGLALVPLHMALGLLFVSSLWWLSLVALKTGVDRKLVAFVVAWGLVMLAFGATQMMLFPAPQHWVVRLAHSLVGMLGMHLGTVLHKRIAIDPRVQLSKN